MNKLMMLSAALMLTLASTGQAATNFPDLKTCEEAVFYVKSLGDCKITEAEKNKYTLPDLPDGKMPEGLEQVLKMLALAECEGATAGAQRECIQLCKDVSVCAK
ncbi:hypothetical protein [Bdellovibrio bacteriovorus]|uniref:hypothetical protein n=1 Tax=Bdellovibrio bacteriovorus TaxID=959 RepID=UPI00045BE767|nr:hypothetical protein [Bdellovibrio bacteriovorus]AHZ85588.1 hypothetical protein EP01_11675 [Bdellovibrio bacteriovorus]BEV70134.1 hypothetical protein Bb109J_c3554 [Bdellovibrio bacteriovorus]